MAQLLIIEDDPEAGDLISRILSADGHSIAMAENGAIGLAKLASARVDLVITDLLMPVVEGLETIREIRRLHPDVKIVAISGIQAGYLETAVKFGAHAALRKPFHPPHLREAVTKLLSVPAEADAKSSNRASGSRRR